MNRLLAPTLLAVSLVAGCGSEVANNMPHPPSSSSQEAAETTLSLTVEHSTYPFESSETRDTKGSGDLGQADRALRVGESVIAACLQHHDSDVRGFGDAVQIAEGEFQGYTANLFVYESSQLDVAVEVFTMPAHEIRQKLGRCSLGKD